jgi:ribosome maturation factor RimP
MSDAKETLTAEVEQAVSARMPEVEVVLVEHATPGLLRVYIDHPAGVDLDLCERVSNALVSVRDRYALEVSSPGLDRPLVKPAHYRRFVGRDVTVTTRDPIAGRRHFRGGLRAAGEQDIELDQDGEAVRIPYEAIRRGRLAVEHAGGMT